MKEHLSEISQRHPHRAYDHGLIPLHHREIPRQGMGKIQSADVPPPPGEDPYPLRKGKELPLSGEGKIGKEGISMDPPCRAAHGNDLHRLPGRTQPDRYQSPGPQEPGKLFFPRRKEVVQRTGQPLVVSRDQPPHPVPIRGHIGAPEFRYLRRVDEHDLITRQGIGVVQGSPLDPRPLDLPAYGKDPHDNAILGR